MMSKSPLLVFTCLSILIMAGCYTRKEACLDGLATNFDVSADDPCDGCCIFPSLVLQVVKKAGDSNFVVTDTLVNSLGQKFRITDLRFYFSDFTLFQANGTQIKTLEFISNSDNSVSVHDDMKIWRWVDETITPGSVKAYGSLDSLTFQLGLNTTLSKTTFSGLPSTHVLLSENKLKYGTINTAIMTLRCVRYQTITDTINISVLNPTETISYKIEKKVTSQKGENINYEIKVDYLSLMKDVNIYSTTGEIESHLMQNLNSFIIVK